MHMSCEGAWPEGSSRSSSVIPLLLAAPGRVGPVEPALWPGQPRRHTVRRTGRAGLTRASVLRQQRRRLPHLFPRVRPRSTRSGPGCKAAAPRLHRCGFPASGLGSENELQGRAARPPLSAVRLRRFSGHVLRGRAARPRLGLQARLF